MEISFNKDAGLPSSEDAEARLWQELFSPERIKDVYIEKIRVSSGPGADRITVARFEMDLDNQVEIISRKCRIGTYRFTPYLEQLMSKGRDKPPRVISIPTIRDKIVLKILTIYLHQCFDSCIAKELPNTVIKKVKKQYRGADNADFIKLDISSFYDNIQHELLLEKIEIQNRHAPFLTILKRAITNPTLAANYSIEIRKKTKNKKGVPQGLSISNILAEIYMQLFDNKVRACSVFYKRFVDDALIFCTPDKLEEAWIEISAALTKLGLTRNTEKSTNVGAAHKTSEPLEYLGYQFSQSGISARQSSYKRFLHSVLGRITKFRYGHSKDVVVLVREKAAFKQALNERITGALDGRRRYGWAFFFSEIDDMAMPFQIDRIIKEALARIDVLTVEDIDQIKKVSRALFEAKYTPFSGYIHNYAQYQSIQERRDYLVLIGFLKDDPDKAYTDDEINRWFEQAKKSNLLKLERDVAMFS